MGRVRCHSQSASSSGRSTSVACHAEHRAVAIETASLTVPDVTHTAFTDGDGCGDSVSDPNEEPGDLYTLMETLAT